MKKYYQSPEYKAKRDNLLTMDDLVGLLRENGGRIQKEEVKGILGMSLSLCRKIGVVQDDENEIWLTDSPLRMALDGYVTN